MKKELKIYISDGCIYCHKLKDGLDKLKIEYTDIDIDNPNNKKEWDKILEFSKEWIIPILTIQPHVLVPGKSFNTIDEAIELVQILMK